MFRGAESNRGEDPFYRRSMLFRGRWLILVSKVNGTNGFQASARIEEAQSRLKQIARATATLEREFKTSFAMLGQTRALFFYRSFISFTTRFARNRTEEVALLSRFFYHKPEMRPSSNLSPSSTLFPLTLQHAGFNSFSTIQLRFFLFIYFSSPLLFVSSNRFFPSWLSLVFSFFLYAFSFLITIALFASALQINRQ